MVGAAAGSGSATEEVVVELDGADLACAVGAVVEANQSPFHLGETVLHVLQLTIPLDRLASGAFLRRHVAPDFHAASPYRWGTGDPVAGSASTGCERENSCVRVTAKVDYAVRAMIELVATDATAPRKAEHISQAQDIPVRFLLNILGELKLAKLVESRRGADGGYWLARPAADIAVADVIRAVEGPLADVHGVPPELLVYRPPAEPLRDVWLGARAALRRVLEQVSLAHIASGSLPPEIAQELDRPGAWERR